MTSERLIVFARFPRPGEAKTRLVPALGAEGAAAAQHEMTLLLLSRLGGFRASTEIRCTGAAPAEMAALYGDDLAYADQGEGDLGERMRRALSDALPAADRAVLVGSDCPDMNAAHVREAFDALGERDVAVAPAQDGGYALIGLARPAPTLFDRIPWGTAGVLETTLARAAHLGLTVALLPALGDVDTPEDLPRWHRARAAALAAGFSFRPPAPSAVSPPRPTAG